jgi:alkylated DNA nucleotide flippase Atl1
VSSIWHHSGESWDLLSPVGFADEASLHDLIAESPHVLPLSGGAPRLVVLGCHVQLGANEADMIAVEPSGRLVLIEVKLAKNAEARRAVVSQILSYAAFLRGLSAEQLEQTVLAHHLSVRAYDNLAAAAAEADQEGSFDLQQFYEGLEESLSSGAFRLVLVLDDAPDELVRLVGYLEDMGPNLVLDLMTVARYEMDGSQLLVPQRVDPVRTAVESKPRTTQLTGQTGESTEGADLFLEYISRSPNAHQPELLRLANWATALQHEGLARLRTYVSQNSRVLLVWIKNEQRGLVTIWNDSGGASLQLWRSVFEKKAPTSIPVIESLIAPLQVGQGNTTRDVSDELLDALAEAYRQAALATGAFDWSEATAAVEAIPSGRWTSYGDVAKLVGTAAQAVGNWAMSPKGPPHAYRVLNASGEISPGFRWDDPDDDRDPRAVLEAEGIEFGSDGRASQAQRLTAEELAPLAAGRTIRGVPTDSEATSAN